MKFESGKTYKTICGAQAVVLEEFMGRLYGRVSDLNFENTWHSASWSSVDGSTWFTDLSLVPNKEPKRLAFQSNLTGVVYFAAEAHNPQDTRCPWLDNPYGRKE